MFSGDRHCTDKAFSSNSICFYLMLRLFEVFEVVNKKEKNEISQIFAIPALSEDLRNVKFHVPTRQK